MPDGLRLAVGNLAAVAPEPVGSRYWIAVPVVAFVLSRVLYFASFGVRFDIEPLSYYIQIIDVELLYSRLLESIYYLRDQPPLFNLMIGALLKISPIHVGELHHAIYLFLGLAIVCCLYWLLASLKIPPWFAAVVATIWAIHPTTVLFENWLMYEYPVTAGLAAAALMLHRFLLGGGTWAGFGFFMLLTLVALLRGTFHLVWMFALAAGVLWLAPNRHQVLRVVLIPLCLVVGVYVKHFGLYHEWVFGVIYQQVNRAIMTTQHLTADEVAELHAIGAMPAAISPPDYDFSVPAWLPYLPPLPDTGIPLLDRVRKATGAASWQHIWTQEVARICDRSAQNAYRRFPHAYWHAVRQNCRGYMVPAGDGYPFNQVSDANGMQLRPVIRAFNLVLAGQLAPRSVGGYLVFALPAALAFGVYECVVLMRRLRRQSSAARPAADRARLGVVLFCVFNILYVSVTTILMSYGDHSRYRFTVMPLYIVLIALLIVRTARWFGGRRHCAADQACFSTTP